MMSNINEDILLVEIEDKLKLLLSGFADNLTGSDQRKRFILKTISESGRLQFISKINEALIAQKNSSPINDARVHALQKDLLRWEDAHFQPELVGNTLEKGRFNTKEKERALELLKTFAQFVGTKGISYFGMPAQSQSNPEKKGGRLFEEVFTINTGFTPEEIESRCQEIEKEIQERNTEISLSEYIKDNLKKERLSVVNAIERARKELSDDLKFRTNYVHLLSFQVFLDDQILIATHKRDQVEINEKISKMNGKIALSNYKEKVLCPRLNELSAKIITASAVGTSPLVSDLEMRDFLVSTIEMIDQKIEKQSHFTGPITVISTAISSAEAIPPNKTVLLCAKEIRENTRLMIETGNAEKMRDYRKENLLIPLFVHMKEIKDKKNRGEDIPAPYHQWEEFLIEQLFMVDDKIKAIETTITVHAVEQTPNQSNLQFGTTEVIAPPETQSSNNNTFTLPSSQNRFLEFGKKFRRHVVAIGTAAMAAVVTISAIGLGMFNSDTQAEDRGESQKLTEHFNIPAPNSIGPSEIVVKDVIQPVEIIPVDNIVLPHFESASHPNPAGNRKIKANFKSRENKDYIINPTIVDGYQMKRITADTVV